DRRSREGGMLRLVRTGLRPTSNSQHPRTLEVGSWKLEVQLEGQPEAELRRPHLRSRVLQELARRAFLRADAPGRTVEHVEKFRGAVERHAAAQRNSLLHPDVGSVLRRCEQVVTRNDRAIPTGALAEVGAGAAHVTTVGVWQSDARREEVECAQLEDRDR